ncbi:phage portal protein [Bradyrhizobium sp. Leo170]|uniref:phage portal protein n=1 Tax=Bradyrhizobium sp. Leo170 TaxID=1571199 RepID=UPI00102E9485|nr:phage portal protein [Bradyrhizobium sp. Leo170]TAI67586.1 hypothetical protein CWO89_01860 [Bradyrhizobium sp. Leo170]
MGWINNAVAAVWSIGRRADDSGDQDRYYGDDADFYYESVGKRSTAGVRITPMAAMRLSAFAACAKVLAETIASLPVSVNKIMPDDGRQAWPSHPIAELIRYQPNRTQTAVEFWESIILHAVLFGTGYAEIVPGTRGAVDQLKFLRSDRVVQDQLRDETLRFAVSNPNTGGSRVLLQDEVLRIPSLSLDGVNGLSMLDLAAESIGLGVAADQYASRIFSNNLNMGGFITTQKRMSREAIRNLIARLMEKYASPENFHRPAILQDGAKFEPASMKASEAQLLEARKWQIAELARYFRIPLHMLGVDDQTNRSTVEEQSINFVKYTIRPWARRIEQAIRRDLIIATGLYEVKFNLDALERGNLAARKDYWAAALGEGGNRPGWMCVNEVRVAEGLNIINEPWAWEVPRGLPAAQPKPAVAQENQANPDDATDAMAAPAPKIGVLQSDALITVPKESGQAAGTVLYQNLVRMIERLWGPSHNSAIWLMSNEVLGVVLDLDAASDKKIFTTDADGTRRLLSYPIEVCEYTPALSSVGDILLGDFSQYIVAQKDDNPDFLSSIHVKFSTDESAFKLRYRVDGAPGWKTPITPKNSTLTVSPFVALGAR